MTEQWKSEAARRFNDKIRMIPSDEFWPQATAPVAEPESELTLIDELENLADAQLNLFRVVVDTWVLGRVA